jgi:hypothetical protein
MAVTRRRSARSGAVTTDAPAPKAKPTVPTLTMPDGTEAPNVVELRKTMKWVDIVAAVNKTAEFKGMDTRALIQLGYKQEPIVDPSLTFKPTAANVAKARESGLRWERITARAGISRSQAEKLYSEATSFAADSSYTGRGRKFPPMVSGPLPVDYKVTHEFDAETKTWVPKVEKKSTAAPTARRARRTKRATPAS